MDRPEDSGVRNEFVGDAERVVLAGRIDGGVHFHSPISPQVPVPKQLPSAPEGFVNRFRQLDLLDATAFGEVERVAGRVLVLDGTAGVGKTALVTHWADRVRERFPDGQLYANLHGYDPVSPADAGAVLRGFLRALGVGAKRIPRDVDECAALFRSEMAQRRALVVLDNAVDSVQVRPLLPGASLALTVITSRNNMRSLVAKEGVARLTLDLLPVDESVQVLERVAGAYRGSDGRGELEDLAALCARLPLALRIAAERMASRPEQSVTELIAELRSDERAWELLSTDDDSLAQAARSVFAWSFRGMALETARLFHLLALHPGPDFALPAVAALAGRPIPTARRQIDLLVGAHLLEKVGAGRFQLHDLLRGYANDQTDPEDEETVRGQALRRILDFYTHSAKAAARATGNDSLDIELAPPCPGIEVSQFTDHADAMRWFEAERANLLAAVRAAAAEGLDTDVTRLAGVLLGLYATNNVFEDWFAVSEQALKAALRSADRYSEAVALESLGKACAQSHRLQEAHDYHGRSLAIRRDIADIPGQARSINALGLVYWRTSRLEQACAAFTEAERLASQSGKSELELYSRLNRANIYIRLGRLEDAVEILGQALPVLRERGDLMAEENAIQDMAAALRGLGRVEQALVCAERAVEISEELGNQVSLAQALRELALTHQACGDLPRSVSLHERVIAIQRSLGDRAREALAHIDAAGALRQLDGTDEAREHLSQASRFYGLLGDEQRCAELARLATTGGQVPDWLTR